jgi:SusD family.
MKRLYQIVLFTVCLAAFASCSDFLDKTPDDDMTKDEVFTNPDWARSWLSNCYSWVHNESNFADDGGAFCSPFTGGCDEMEIAFGGAFSHMINSGSWNATNIYRVPIWSETYCGLRCVNTFLENIGKVPNLTQDDYNSLRGEALFLRAFFHFQAFRAYGPIPVVQRRVGTDEDWTAIVRENVDVVSAAIAGDCDSAAYYLPSTRPQTEYGRPNKAAAKALKSRLLLYVASPLYNGNSELADLKDPETGENLIPQQYDAEKWKKAADAAEDALKACKEAGLKLHYSDTKDPRDNYEEIFVDNWNDEIIWAKNLGDYWHYMWCSDPISFGCPSIFNPTQEMVDSYEMADGSTPISGYKGDGLTPVINSASGYQEAGYASSASSKGYWPAGVRNMYVNREPRFYASINFAGQVWKHNHALAFWYSGVDGKKYGSSDYCKTGYLMRKHNNINITSNPFVATRTTWNFFRVGELYLNYAEALNEYSGPVKEVYAAVDTIRARAGLPCLAKNLTKDEMRERIKHERRIELAFENHRFFDERRWKDAPQLENKSIHCMNIYAGDALNDDKFYQRVVCEERIFESPKHYFFPIPQSEIDKNSKRLVQNPGW